MGTNRRRDSTPKESTLSGPREEMWANIERLGGTRPYREVRSVAQLDLDPADVHRANQGTAAAVEVAESCVHHWTSTEEAAGRDVEPGHYRVTLNDQYNADVITTVVVKL